MTRDFYSHDIAPTRHVSEHAHDLEYRFGQALAATTELGQVRQVLTNFLRAMSSSPDPGPQEVPELSIAAETFIEMLVPMVGPALKVTSRDARERGHKQAREEIAAKLGLGVLR